MIVAALAVPVAIAGCVEEPENPTRIGPGVHAALAGAALRTVGAPGAPDIPFGEALVTFSRMIGEVHAFRGPRADPPIHAAVRQLATILDRMPAAAAQPALRRAAALLRAHQDSVEPEEASVEHTRRALALAATALLDLAQGSYAGSPDVAAKARAFAGAVESIDPDRDPPDRAAIVTALVSAERALAAMYAVNVRPPALPAAP